MNHASDAVRMSHSDVKASGAGAPLTPHQIGADGLGDSISRVVEPLPPDCESRTGAPA